MPYYGDELRAFNLNNIPSIQPGDDVSEVIHQSLESMGETLQQDDILVIASKIISKADNLFVDLRTIKPSEKAERLGKETDKRADLVELILRQGRLLGYKKPSQILMRLRNGITILNAGIDRYNLENQTDNDDIAVLLPPYPNESCKKIASRLKNKYDVDAGIIIQDSASKEWRLGTTGICLGAYGVRVIDTDISNPIYRSKDMFGIGRGIWSVNLGDQLAGLGNLLIGEAGDKSPIMLIRGLHLADKSQSSFDLLTQHEGESAFNRIALENLEK
jgi:coenzyme F420-0:L-glutamate ligase/coenzyme F420-1:gamma-L-glutamate ligase